MPVFKDHFSAQAADYARYRPHYPAGLFRWLAEASPARALPWDSLALTGIDAAAPHCRLFRSCRVRA